MIEKSKIQRHAYLIMAYNNWRQLGMLLELLDDPRNDLFLHIDKRAGEFPEAQLRAAVKQSRLEFIPRKNVYWADYSQTDVELDLLEAASAAGKYHYYHLLSGMCLPIKTQDEIHGFFDGQDKEFIGMIRDGGEYIKKHANYCHIWTNTPLYRTCKPVKAISRGLVEVQKLLGIDRLRKENLTVSTGWTWFSVTDGHCRYLLENREFIHRIFRNTLASDEMFMGTMVVNFGLEDRLYDITGVDCYDYTVGSKRLIDWERGKPYVWGQETPEEDFAELMSSHCMFARKFDERINFEIIQRIYDTLKNR